MKSFVKHSVDPYVHGGPWPSAHHIKFRNGARLMWVGGSAPGAPVTVIRIAGVWRYPNGELTGSEDVTYEKEMLEMNWIEI